MADSPPVVHIGENSPEHVAYRLLQQVMNIERMSPTQDPAQGWRPADRKWLLDTYAECLQATKGFR